MGKESSTTVVPPVSAWFVNPSQRGLQADGNTARESLDPRSVHRMLPGYAPSPLVEAPSIAIAAGLERVWIKDESFRLGLPSFKILGASYALYRALRQRLGEEREWVSFDDWKKAADKLKPLTLVTATEGNHGRAVAYLAKCLGLDARVYVQAAMAEERLAALRSEGAQVEIVDGTYDDAVTVVADLRNESSELILSDTAWEGYEQIPEWVIEGYETIFAEVDTQLQNASAPQPDLVIVQAGVGALASATTLHWLHRPQESTPRIVAVEPEHAACVMAGLKHGEPLSIPGPFDSIMNGLNCGLASPVAIRHLTEGLDGVVTVADIHARTALRMMHHSGVQAGATGAAGVAALLALHASDGDTRIALGIDSAREALVICTEGVTNQAEIAAILDA